MKYDFSKPLTEEQMEVVRWTQENGDDAVKAGEYFDMDPATVFKWTIQDYEEQRQPLMKQGFEEMTDELLHQINSIYECEVNLRKNLGRLRKRSEGKTAGLAFLRQECAGTGQELPAF